jgi:hypothetical protein
MNSKEREREKEKSTFPGTPYNFCGPFTYIFKLPFPEEKRESS